MIIKKYSIHPKQARNKEQQQQQKRNKGDKEKKLFFITAFNVSRQNILFKNSDSQTQQKYQKPFLSYLQDT